MYRNGICGDSDMSTLSQAKTVIVVLTGSISFGLVLTCTGDQQESDHRFSQARTNIERYG